MTSELKPCPFCGGDDVFGGDDGADYRSFEVSCDNCFGATRYHATEAEAIAAWNTRPTPVGVSELADELERRHYAWATAGQDAKLNAYNLLEEALLDNLPAVLSALRSMPEEGGEG